MTTSVLTTLDFGGVGKITGLPEPTAAQDAATKSYVDSAVEGLAWKDGVRVASAANINLASPGSTIDGVALSANDRVLVKDQTTANQNGIYIWNGAATPMTRSLDASTFPELEQATVTVEEGTSAGTSFRQSAVNGTIGVTDILWGTFGASVPPASASTAGIARIATQTDVDNGTVADEFVSPETLASWSGRKRKHGANIGDGTATSYAVTHNFGTRDIIAQLYRNSGNYDQVIADVEHTDANTVTFKFAAAVALNAYRAVVIG